MGGRASGASHYERASSVPRLDGMVMEVERIGEEIIFDTVVSSLSFGLHSFSFLTPKVVQAHSRKWCNSENPRKSQKNHKSL